MQRRRGGVGCAAIAACLLAALGLAGSASAEPLGDFARFKYCPWTDAEVDKCLYAVTNGGEIVLGKRTVPLGKNSMLLQGGLSEPVAEFSTVFAATNDATLVRNPQPIPGGLAGLVPEASSSYLVKRLIKFFFENKLTVANLSPELATPASDLRFSEAHLLAEKDVALELPLKLRLENPFLGKRCYVGSAASPVELELTTGATSPAAPNKPIEGSAGKAESLGGGEILRQNGAKLVDNAWAAPAATGCGGVIAFLVDPIVNAQLGKMAAGSNTAILTGVIDLADAAAVKLCDEDDCF
jgi:hypothetical protein